MIIQGLTDEIARKYRGTEYISNPAAVWRQIEADHRDKVKLNVHHLRIQLCDVKLEECGSIEAYAERFQSLCDQITLAGQIVSDSERFFYMMEGLPSEWDNYRDIMAGRVTTSDAWQELIPLLLVKEAELRNKRNIPAEGALYGKSWKKGKKGEKRGKGEKFAGKCDGCGKKGHKKVDCWLEDANKEKRPKWWKEKDEAKAVTTVATTTGESDDQAWAVRDIEPGDSVMAAKATARPDWVLDSGCTRHMTPHRGEFKTFRAIPDGQHAIETATGERVFATGSGSVTVIMDTPDGKSRVNISDVLFVAKCEASLISVHQLLQRGIEVKFAKDQATITRGNRICAIARERNKLFILNRDGGDTAYKTKDSARIWHYRLAHIDPGAFTKLPTMVVGMPIVKTTGSERCKSCLLGKMTRTPFKDSTHRVKAPLQRVYMDLCGPMKTQSIGGRSYFMLITDEYTRY